MTPSRPPGTTTVSTPLWLSHHQPDAYDRCLVVAGRQVCRRCAVLYPVAFVVLGVALTSGGPPDEAARWIMALFPLPAVVEWWLEHLGRVQYAPARQAATSVPLGIALGIGLSRYLDNPGDLAFWTMVLVYGGGCLAVAAWRFLDERAP